MAVQNAADNDVDWVAFTIRFPQAVHEWLRCEAFHQRTTMSEIVREAVESRMPRSARIHGSAPGFPYENAVAVGETTGPMKIVKP